MKKEDFIHSVVAMLAESHTAGEAKAIVKILLEDLQFNHTSTLSANDLSALDKAVDRLLNHEPVQYVTSKAFFYGNYFKVSPAVLIPRPETEELVDLIIKENKDAEKPAIIDIGTGSGCIAISLKKHLDTATVYAIDISNAALEVAEKNARQLKTNVNFLEQNILSENLSITEKFDVIVSNPPYIPVSEKKLMDKNVVEYEPHIALFVDDEDPLLFYKAILKFAQSSLTANGKIYLETHQQIAVDVKKLFDENGFTSVVKKDLNGNDRIVTATPHH